MTTTITSITATLLMLALAGQAKANVEFTFLQQGGTVTMTSSGTLDTTKLVSVSRPDGWGGTGTENNPAVGDIDIMGGTSFGPVDTQFGFHAGTDVSAISNPGGPFAFTSIFAISITGTESFTTYSGFIGAFRQPGIGMVASDIIGGLWTPNQNWVYPAGSTFASLGLVPGTYTVADSLTRESITIEIGPSASVPDSGAGWAGVLTLVGLCGVGYRTQVRRLARVHA